MGSSETAEISNYRCVCFPMSGCLSAFHCLCICVASMDESSKPGLTSTFDLYESLSNGDRSLSGEYPRNIYLLTIVTIYDEFRSKPSLVFKANVCSQPTLFIFIYQHGLPAVVSQRLARDYCVRAWDTEHGLVIDRSKCDLKFLSMKFDSSKCFNHHVNVICKSSYFLFHDIGGI